VRDALFASLTAAAPDLHPEPFKQHRSCTAAALEKIFFFKNNVILSLWRKSGTSLITLTLTLS
jgi:hypothetical protein